MTDINLDLVPSMVSDQSSQDNKFEIKKSPLTESNDLLSSNEKSSSSNSISSYFGGRPLLNEKRGRPTPSQNYIKFNLAQPAAKSKGKNKVIKDFFKPASNPQNPYSPTNSIQKKKFDSIIQQKDKEIEELKTENAQLSLLIKKNEQNFQEEEKISNQCIISLLKELEALKKKNFSDRIHELQRKYGKSKLSKNGKGQYVEIWEDGEEMIKLKNKLERLNEAKKKLSNENLSEISSFEKSTLMREEKKLSLEKEFLELNKLDYLLDMQTYLEEESSKYNNKWPLLNQRYQILSLLGKGGYSEVYKAFDLKRKQYVACKIYFINQNWSEEVYENYIKHSLREIEVQRNMTCSKIIKQLDIFKIDDMSFCTVLELCNGKDLGAYMKKNKNLTEKEIHNIIKQILVGLEYLSSQKFKIIHYDLKPQNILFHNNEIKISDFGTCKVIDSETTNTNNIELTSQGTGTYYYLPPECFEMGRNVKINNKVDIWSLGIICYEMVYGKKPFGQGCSQDKMFDIMSDYKKINFPSQPEVSQECKDFMMKCLEWKSDKRFDVEEALSSKFISSMY